MKKINLQSQNSPLFQGIEHGNLQKMLHCLAARQQRFDAGEIVLLSGARLDFVGLILQGRVTVMCEDASGSCSILAELHAPELFGEVFACAGVDFSPVTVQSTEKTEVLFVDYRRIIEACSSSCPFHHKLIANMLRIVSSKSLELNQKIAILSKRSSREKILAFLHQQAQGKKSFTISFSREEMAQYLCIDRSALSAELGKMRREGLLVYKRNFFEMLK